MPKDSYTNIKFVKPTDKSNITNGNIFDAYMPKKKISTYYQICQFKSKFTKLYDTRKIVFNELGDILKIYERSYTYDELSTFMKHHRQNKFKIYPVNDVQQIEMPSTADIICCESELLNGNSNGVNLI